MTTFALFAAAIALIGCLVVGFCAELAVRTFRPGQAVVLLVGASFALSLACGVALTAIAIAVVAAFTAVASQGHWSATAIQAQIALPGWLGAGSTAVVSALLLRAVWRTGCITSALVRAERLCRNIRATSGPVLIVDDDSADAYTVAGITGCIVLSRRLLDHLSADERRVVTAHELSHLSRRHHLYVHVADIAAAGNPLLRRVPIAVRGAVERWADEDASTGTGDRRTTARTVARVALLRSGLVAAATPGTGRRPWLALGISTYSVASRVLALFEPAPRGRGGLVVLAVVLSMLVLLAGMVSLDHTQDAIESAFR